MGHQLRSADTLLAPVVHDTIRALQLQPEDIAAVKLAHQYAAAPRARKAAKGVTPTRAESRLAALRAARSG